MSVSFSTLLARYAMSEIKDINWTRELEMSAARFFRAKSDLVIASIPLFNRPPEVQGWLGYKAPEYDDYLYTAGDDVPSQDPVVIATGKAGYELCSAVKVGTDAAGFAAYTPVSVEYDQVTGSVTVPAGVLNSGDQVDIDFYTDGVFEREITPEMCSILAQCMAVKWFERDFGNDWLDNKNKIKDKSFDVGSVSAQMTAVTTRKKENRLALNDRLLHFEQNVAMRQVIPPPLAWKPPAKATQTP